MLRRGTPHRGGRGRRTSGQVACISSHRRIGREPPGASGTRDAHISHSVEMGQVLGVSFSVALPAVTVSFDLLAVR
jgi:hypothetical protein